MSTFIVVKEGGSYPWTIRHTPSGLGCGYFTYQRFARAAAQAMNDLVEICPDLKEVQPNNDSLTDLLRVRKPHKTADEDAYCQRKAKSYTGKGK